MLQFLGGKRQPQRRNDAVADLKDFAGGTRFNQRNYQRGVHRGERIDPQDYAWPRDFNPDSGIERQARTTKKFAPIGTINDHLVADGRFPIPRGAEGIITVDRNRAQQLARLAPGWR